MKQSSSLFRRTTLVAFLALAAARNAGAGEPTTDPTASFRDTIRPLLTTHCASCHGPESPKADLDLTRFATPAAVAADFPQWEAVLEQIRSGSMPPKRAKSHPTPAERQAVAAWTDSLRAFEAKRNAGDPGVVLARRLNNAEYDHTVRDLTGVDFRPARDFPVDPANAAGFDNSGESLRMSPALLTKYLAAARHVAAHLVLKPQGFEFAPYPAIADTDRDKFCVRRIVDFYLRQPTDLADYFQAAWHYRHRAALGRPQTTLADCATADRVSSRYLPLVWAVLSEPADERGPVAALQALWKTLPAPKDGKADGLRAGCERMRDFVTQVRERVKVKVENLTVRGMNPGAQALVLWKDRQMAASRRSYGGGGLKLDMADYDFGPAAALALSPPPDEAGRQRFEKSFERFCSVFPDAFYVKERGRVFLNPNVDRLNTGRLLSAGFHNQMGYFRDDQPLRDLILNEADTKHLDRLWEEFDFISDVPARMHSGLIWFERSESSFLAGTEFDFARAEDKDVVSPDKFRRFADDYLKKTKRSTTDPEIGRAVEDHFRISEADIRRVERTRVAAEPTHVAALQDFAERAYRRRLSAADRAGVADFYRSLRTEGVAHDEAVRDTLASILVSPHFLFRVDLPLGSGAARPGTAVPLSDEALANRLSYFLWASMPDRDLLDLAAQGKLRDPGVLVAQARRMLGDERARGLATQFGGNWLDFLRFEEHNAVDRGRYPQFDNDLRQAMAEEPVRFLLDVIQNDRSVLELVSGKHTFVNGTLARHYGMPAPPQGGGWVRVDDAGEYGRGGLLPMAAFLTKNSPGLRTSPVKRGYWVVTRLLGERIPAPPPNVPELPADEKKLGTRSLRETLARHRADASCAGCHARFDSFGLAFEGFGPIGERRTMDLAGHAVDARVDFPGGRTGEGVAGLRTYLREHRTDAFVETLCRKLLAYALGRNLILSDDPLVARMQTELGRNDYHFGRLVEIIVTSPQFRNRRGPGAPKAEGAR